MKNLKSKLTEFILTNQKVFLRADLNVSILNGRIIDDFKLKALQPTLDYLISQKAKIILATHIGQPKTTEANLSTKQLLPWFIDKNYNIIYKANLEEHNIENGQILLLENLRFWPEEKSADINLKKKFAQKLSKLSDYYINDAFGVSYHQDTSVTELPKLFDVNHKTIGFLIEKEIFNLNKITQSPNRPFVLILGGNKVAEKLPLIKNLLSQADHILLCPALTFTFLKALNKPIGKSLVDNNQINNALEIIKLGNNKLVFPQDFLIATDNNYTQLSYTNSVDIPDNYIGMSIGPKTLNLYNKIISEAKTIFLNGTMGFASIPDTQKEFRTLLQTVSHNNTCYSIIGGGDSVAAVYEYGFNTAINFCSTGGGATLAYLSGQEMPGIINTIS